jgi:hypothetical protein
MPFQEEHKLTSRRTNYGSPVIPLDNNLNNISSNSRVPRTEVNNTTTNQPSMSIIDLNNLSTTIIESDPTDDAITKYCDEIFREAPIRFKCRKGNKLEEHLQKLIKKLNITVPIVHSSK